MNKKQMSGNAVAALITAILVLGLVALITSIRIVGTGQIGVVTQFGDVTGRELSEGMHLVKPFWIETVKRYDVKVQKQETQNAAASSDLQDVNGTIVLNYRIERGKVSHMHQNVGQDYREKLIDPAVSEIFKSVSSRYSATRLISERPQVKADTQKGVSERLEKYGIVIDDVSITNLEFSEAFTKSIEEKQVAQQNAERAKFNLEAAKTDAEAQKAQSETLSKEYLQKQAIDKWDGKLPQYLGGGTVFNIPLQ